MNTLSDIESDVNNSLFGLPFSRIINFVMGCEFGVPFNPNPNDIEHEGDYYKYLTPQQFEKYKMGTCWDFVTYLTWRFRKDFPNLKTHPIWMDKFIHKNDNETQTHVVFLVDYNNYTYWIEGAWFDQKGVHTYRSLDIALSEIQSKFIESKIERMAIVSNYNPLDNKLFGLDQYEAYEQLSIQALRNPLFISNEWKIEVESGRFLRRI